LRKGSFGKLWKVDKRQIFAWTEKNNETSKLNAPTTEGKNEERRYTATEHPLTTTAYLAADDKKGKDPNKGCEERGF
jgi:hypothetical protein